MESTKGTESYDSLTYPRPVQAEGADPEKMQELRSVERELARGHAFDNFGFGQRMIRHCGGLPIHHCFEGEDKHQGKHFAHGASAGPFWFSFSKKLKIHSGLHFVIIVVFVCVCLHSFYSSYTIRTERRLCCDAGIG